MDGVWLSYVVTEFLVFIIAIILLVASFKRMNANIT